MRHKLICGGFATFMLLLFALNISFAHEVTMMAAARLGDGPSIEAGKYRIELIKTQDSSHAVFYQHGEEVARAPVTLVSEPSKASRTAVYSEQRDDGRVITRIDLQGSQEALVFVQATEQSE